MRIASDQSYHARIEKKDSDLSNPTQGVCWWKPGNVTNWVEVISAEDLLENNKTRYRFGDVKSFDRKTNVCRRLLKSSEIQKTKQSPPAIAWFSEDMEADKFASEAFDFEAWSLDENSSCVLVHQNTKTKLKRGVGNKPGRCWLRSRRNALWLDYDGK